jgi:hypothetical protein
MGKILVMLLSSFLCQGEEHEMLNLCQKQQAQETD